MMKRLFDIVASGLGLIVLSPLFIILAIWIKLDSKGLVFYRQVRVGRYNKDFRIFKFRSMRVGADKGSLVTIGGRDPRVTRSGYWIRKFKLDELPQLINVFKGDMALIGPRPLLPQYLPLYSLEQARRHEVRPGISGWAQCHGRNAISWTEKFKLDVWYVDHVSLITDLKVIFITIKKVLFKEDINQVGGEWATMDPFNGHN
jgi:lipopolysaccharide/colanic/teichoic acid biosynthesis glycosyltransferase